MGGTRTRARSALLCCLVAVALLAGCGDAQPVTPPDLGPLLLEVVYQGTSAERPLEELYLHSAVGNYGGAADQLQKPLEPGEKVELTGLSKSSQYLTVVRRILPLAGSDLIALTTASPLSLQTGRVVVWVFDESFRVYDPVSNK